MKKSIQVLTIFAFFNLIGNFQGIYYGYFGDGQRPELSIFWGFSMLMDFLFALFFIHFAITNMEGTLRKKVWFLINEFIFAFILILIIAFLAKYF